MSIFYAGSTGVRILSMWYQYPNPVRVVPMSDFLCGLYQRPNSVRVAPTHGQFHERFGQIFLFSIPTHVRERRESGVSLKSICWSFVYQFVTHIVRPFLAALTHFLTTRSQERRGFIDFGIVTSDFAVAFPRNSVSTQPGQKQVARSPYFLISKLSAFV